VESAHAGRRAPSVVHAKENGGYATRWRAESARNPLWCCASLWYAKFPLLSALAAATGLSIKAAAKHATVSFGLVTSFELRIGFMVVSLMTGQAELHEAAHNKRTPKKADPIPPHIHESMSLLHNTLNNREVAGRLGTRSKALWEVSPGVEPLSALDHADTPRNRRVTSSC
jgi:hypothetical protein